MHVRNPLLTVWRSISALGLEFWLPLPLIAMSIWFGGKGVANQMLSYKSDTQSYLEANNQVRVQLSAAILAIKAEIKQQAGFTKVSIKTADSAIKKLEIELRTTDIAAIEAGITQELGLDLPTVKRITRYQFSE
jgi:multidrug efflux pump subunit AcrA (membrane-fusion protein)